MWRWRAALIAAAIGLALAPLPPSAVERWYSSGLYPVLQSLLTHASNLTPIALFDVLLAAVIAWHAWRLIRDMSRHRARPLAHTRSSVLFRLAVRLVTSGAALYLAFLIIWGLNYRRVPLAGKLRFDAAAVSPDRARDLAYVAVAKVNELYDAAHAADPALRTAALSTAFAEAERVLGVRHQATPARPKRSILNPYFRAAAVDGMTDPYFLETLVVSDLLPVEQPFVVAHEWSHLAGFADESEANFIGWLTCVRGSSEAQYSGWLFLYSELAGGLRRADRVAVSAELAPGPRQDLRAIADRVNRHVNVRVSNAGWYAYDRYLKANRVQAGTASYAEVVRLILGATFGPDWTPLLRDGETANS